jgi:hypothetical protein
MIRADLADLHHRFRAKRTAQTKAEYASAIEKYRRPSTKTTKFAYCVAAVFLFAAVVIGAMR